MALERVNNLRLSKRRRSARYVLITLAGLALAVVTLGGWAFALELRETAVEFGAVRRRFA